MTDDSVECLLKEQFTPKSITHVVLKLMLLESGVKFPQNISGAS